MSRAARAWPCVASAAMLVLASLPIHLELLSLIALVPWLSSLRSTTRRGAWKSGYLLGFLLGLGQLNMIGVLTYRVTGSVILMILPMGLAAAAFALYFGWAGIQIRKCFERGWIWMIPFVWVGIEVFRSYIPVFAFPYALISIPLWRDAPLIQTAWFGSAYLVSFWVVAGNLVALQLLDRKVPQFKPMAVCFVVLALVSIGRWLMPGAGTSIHVAAIQPGVDMAFGDAQTRSERLSAALTRQLAATDRSGAQLVVMPEGIADGSRMPPILPFVPGTTPVVFGGRRGTGPVFQSAFGFDQNGFQWADKTRLVIFGEFVPGRSTFPFIAKAFSLPTGDMSAGTNGTQAFTLDGLRVGPVICFEGLFPDIATRQAFNGVAVLTVISIDDWYMGTGAPDQLRAASIFRAIETNLPLVRSASQGSTMIVDRRGNVVREVPIGTEGKIDATVLTRPHGNFPLMAVFPIASVAMMLVFGWLPAPRNRRDDSSNSVN